MDYIPFRNRKEACDFPIRFRFEIFVSNILQINPTSDSIRKFEKVELS